jgi:hypothetical protein
VFTQTAKSISNTAGSELTRSETYAGLMSINFCALTDIGSFVMTNILLNNEILKFEQMTNGRRKGVTAEADVAQPYET